MVLKKCKYISISASELLSFIQNYSGTTLKSIGVSNGHVYMEVNVDVDEGELKNFVKEMLNITIKWINPETDEFEETCLLNAVESPPLKMEYLIMNELKKLEEGKEK